MSLSSTQLTGDTHLLQIATCTTRTFRTDHQVFATEIDQLITGSLEFEKLDPNGISNQTDLLVDSRNV